MIFQVILPEIIQTFGEVNTTSIQLWVWAFEMLVLCVSEKDVWNSPPSVFLNLQEQENFQDCSMLSLLCYYTISPSQALKYCNSLSCSNISQIFYVAITTFPRKRVVIQRSFVSLASTMSYSALKKIPNFSPWISTYLTNLSLWRHLINA